MRNQELSKLIDIIRSNGLVDESTKQSPQVDHRRMGMPALRTLDVGENVIGENGGASLLLLVNIAPNLTRVHCDGTRIDDSTMRAIHSACMSKLANQPSTTKIVAGKKRYMTTADIGMGNDLDEWKHAFLESLLEKRELSNLIAVTEQSDDAARKLEAAERERDKATIRLLLRSLQTESDIVGLLVKFSEQLHPEVWRDVRVVRRFVKRLVETGNHRKAVELADRFLKPRKNIANGDGGLDNQQQASTPPPPCFENDSVLQWWRVYALARSRNFTDAFRSINDLLPKVGLTPSFRANLLSLAAMLRKCLYESGSKADRDSLEYNLQEDDANASAALYLKAYETAHGLMEGIAAATMLRLGGKEDESTQLARTMLQQASAELALLNRRPGPNNYASSGTGTSAGTGTSSNDVVERKLNALSTLAEASINLQRPNAAFKFYQQAVEAAGSNVNHLSQLQQNLQLLSAARVRIGDVLQLFQSTPGNVCVFHGLAIDHPTMDTYCFPPDRNVELELLYRIDQLLNENAIQIGFVSLSCGSEILFAEKLLERKAEVHVVLPFALDDFLSACVDYGGFSSLSKWRARAQSILARCCEVHHVSNERFLNDVGLFQFQEWIMEGLAIIRAREVGGALPIAMAVLDSHPSFAACRPNAFIRNWKARYGNTSNSSGSNGREKSTTNTAVTCTIDMQDVRRKVLQLPNQAQNQPNRTQLVRRFSEAMSHTSMYAEDGSNSCTFGMGSYTSQGSYAESEGMFTAKPPSSPSAAFLNRRWRGAAGAGISNASTPSSSTSSLLTVNSASSSSSPSLLPRLPSTTSSTGRALTALQFARQISRVVKFTLFADIECVPGHGSISEEQTPIFFKTMFKILEKTRKTSQVGPFYGNTWSSGLYFIFHTVEACAEFSLHLLQIVSSMDWTSLGLPPAQACMGMHGGPLFPGFNPVEEKELFFGSHVCRAARIKAITPLGHAYASEQFVAALAVADVHSKKFFFEYLGQRDLAKSYDRCAVYRLCRLEDVRRHAIIESEDMMADSSAAASSTRNTTTPSSLRINTDESKDSHRPISVRIRRERHLSGRSSNSHLLSTPIHMTPAEVGGRIIQAGPMMNEATIQRANPNIISRFVEQYLSEEGSNSGASGSDGSIVWWSDVSLIRALVSRLIALGQSHVAFLVVQKALGFDSPFRMDLQLKYLRVLALRHAQKSEEFMKELKLALQNHPNPSTVSTQLRAQVLSLAGRMLKDKFYHSLRTLHPDVSLAHESAREYFFAFELERTSFPAINAATMLRLSGEKTRAQALAKMSVRLVAEELVERSKQIWNPNAATAKMHAAAASAGADLVITSPRGSLTPRRRLSLIGSGLGGEEEVKMAMIGDGNGQANDNAPGEVASMKEVGQEYWLYAAMGEAYLVMDEPAKSVSWYAHALNRASGHMGSISTMYRNLVLLQSCLKVPDQLIKMFQQSLGRVLVCSAHPLIPWRGRYEPPDDVVEYLRAEEAKRSTQDHSSRSRRGSLSSPTRLSSPPSDSLPPSLRYYRLLESRTLSEIRHHLSSSHSRPSVAFVLLLVDTDLLFAECLLDLGCELHVCLVHTKTAFLDHCLEHGFQRLHQWRNRIEMVFKRAIVHFITRDQQKSQKQLMYHYNRRVLLGLAMLRARQLDCGPPLAIAVLDGLKLQRDADVSNTGQDGCCVDAESISTVSRRSHRPYTGTNTSSESTSSSSPPLSTSHSHHFPPLDRSSAGLDFPQQWCALDSQHSCTIINIEALRRIVRSQLRGENEKGGMADGVLGSGARMEKNGEWSASEYDTSVAPSVMHSRAPSECLDDIAERLQLTIDTALDTSAIGDGQTVPSTDSSALPTPQSALQTPLSQSSQCTNDPGDAHPSPSSRVQLATSSTDAAPATGGDLSNGEQSNAPGNDVLDSPPSSSWLALPNLSPSPPSAPNNDTESSLTGGNSNRSNLNFRRNRTHIRSNSFDAASAVAHAAGRVRFELDHHISPSHRLSSRARGPAVGEQAIQMEPDSAPSVPATNTLRPPLRISMPSDNETPSPIAPVPVDTLTIPLTTRSASGDLHTSPSFVVHSSDVSPRSATNGVGGGGDRSHRRHPSITHLADCIVPHASPLAFAPVRTQVDVPEFVHSGMDGVRLENEHDEHHASQQADAISKAVDAIHITPVSKTSLPALRVRRESSIGRGGKGSPLQRSPRNGGVGGSRFFASTMSVTVTASSPSPTPASPTPSTPSHHSSAATTATIVDLQRQASEEYYKKRNEAAAASLALLLPDSNDAEKKEDKDKDKERPNGAAETNKGGASIVITSEDAASATSNAQSPRLGGSPLPHSSIASSPRALPPRSRHLRSLAGHGHRRSNSTPLSSSILSQLAAESAAATQRISLPPSPSSVNSTPIATSSETDTTSTQPSPMTPTSSGVVFSVPEIASAVPRSSPEASSATFKRMRRSASTRGTRPRTSSRPSSPASASASASGTVSRSSHRHRAPLSMTVRGGKRHTGRSSSTVASNSAATSINSFIGPTRTEASYSRAIRFLLFADVRNYSKLSQEQTPLFCTHFLTIVRQVIDLFLGFEPLANTSPEHTAPPSTLDFFNTWGDGLFVVFRDAAACARFALVLLQKVHHTRWQLYGLPPELTMRVGLHAGPVMIGWDPIVKHTNFFGPHVSYAQLIEPITTPGCVFATEAFASMLVTAPDAEEFNIDYVGSSVLPLGKEGGEHGEYEGMSIKERNDADRCHLYHVSENKIYSSTRVPLRQDEEHNTPIAAIRAAHVLARTEEEMETDRRRANSRQVQPTTDASTPGNTAIDAASSATSLQSALPSAISRDGDHEHGHEHAAPSVLPLYGSPSVTHSLLRLDELNTQRHNQQQDRSITMQQMTATASGSDAHTNTHQQHPETIPEGLMEG